MSATPYESIPLGEIPSIASATLHLRKDFYNSFNFSQGHAGIQGMLLDLVASTYDRSWTHEGMIGVMPAAFKRAEPIVDGLSPPSNHAPQSIGNVREEAPKQWGVFETALATTITDGPLSKDGFDRRVKILSKAMPFRDMRYVLLGRGDPKSSEPTYESLYRTYILEGQSSGSEAFDVICASLRQRHLSQAPGVELNYLKAAWEWRHDEPFYPENYLEDLKQSSRYVKARHHASPFLGGLMIKAAVFTTRPYIKYRIRKRRASDPEGT